MLEERASLKKRVQELEDERKAPKELNRRYAGYNISAHQGGSLQAHESLDSKQGREKVDNVATESLVPYSDWEKLTVKYDKLSTRYEELTRAYALLQSKFRREIDKWQKHFSQCRLQSELNAEVVSSRPSVLLNEHKTFPSPPGTVKPGLQHTRFDALPDIKPLEGVPTSSQSTEVPLEGEETFEPAIRNPVVSDDDIPIVVSERSLKRKQRPSSAKAAIRICEDATASPRLCDEAMHVKAESLDSSPPAPLHWEGFERTETLDLDEVGRETMTPRKKRRLDELHRMSQDISSQASGLSRHRHERSSSVPVPSQEHAIELSERGIIPEISDLANGNSTPSKEATRIKKEHRATSLPGETVTSIGSNSKSQAAQSRRGNPLRPLSVNSRLTRDTRNEKGRKTKDRARETRGKVWLVTEDGEHERRRKSSNSDTQSVPGGTTTAQTTRKVEGGRRLSSLLRSPPHVEKAYLSPVTAPRKRADMKHLGNHQPQVDTPTAQRTERVQPCTRKIQDKGCRSPEQPLRQKPINLLSVDDFKVNPKCNQGVDYAFTETVRNRDARRCLPGCTRPACCGTAIRKVVEIGGAPNISPRGLWDSSQDDPNDEQRLLEDYVGDDRGRLEGNSSEARKELLIEAQAKTFADRHGRHRHAFERRVTPPGFWRTDMPTTQEVERDREAAKRMDKDRVDERYREAMREQGRWIFRDE